MLTGKESVRKCAREIRKELARLQSEAGLLKQREEWTWSAEEKSLVDAASSIDTLATFIYEADKAKNTAARAAKKRQMGRSLSHQERRGPPS